ncbi:hypothetical protein ABER75_11540 [Niallia taxi]|uniref:hypothetical protein n=1 Tax=Niallia taxi TaxID=2499688 RepID=UPI00203E8E9B|nr:hypothetical protein [Niallia taxi]MCM3216726.1 hypothetical protein [Niallia taxi]
MPVKPFSVQRFILYLSWIGFSALVLYLNSIFNPIYDSNTFVVLVSFCFFFTAAFSLTDIIGINKKVSSLEESIRDNEFRELIKDDVHKMVQDVRPRLSNTVAKEETGLEKYDKAYRDAKSSWKKKTKEDRNSFENYHFILNQLRKIYKYITVVNIFLSMALGLLLLNTLSPIMYLYVISAFLLIYLPFFQKRKKLKQKERDLYQEITPTELKDFLDRGL